MIDLARGNPAFRPVIERALIGEPEAILLVEFAGDDARRAGGERSRDLVELMGDLGLPGSVVEMTDAGAQKALWEVRKAGLNIMMSMKGDGKPVSFIEDCAVPLEHLAEYIDRLTEVFAQARHARHLVRARVGRHAARAADPRHAPRRRGEDARDRRGGERDGARIQGRVLGRARRRPVRGEWVAWQFGPRLNAAFEEIKDLFDPAGLMNPGKIVRAAAHGRRARCSASRPAIATLPLETALDWSAWNVAARSR